MNTQNETPAPQSKAEELATWLEQFHSGMMLWMPHLVALGLTRAPADEEQKPLVIADELRRLAGIESRLVEHAKQVSHQCVTATLRAEKAEASLADSARENMKLIGDLAASTALVEKLRNEAQILVNIIKSNTSPEGVCVLTRDMTIGLTKALALTAETQGGEKK